MSAILQSDGMDTNIFRFSIPFIVLNFMQDNINILQSLIDNVPLGMWRSATVPSLSAHISQYGCTLNVIFR